MKSEDRTVDVRLRAAVESSPSGLLMIDETGRIVLVNREVERMFGYSREELLGKVVEMLVPERFRGEHAALRTGFFGEPRMRSMGAGRDLFGLCKDGSEVPVEIGLTPVATEEGLFVLSSIVDISARKRADERFRVAVESSPNGMLMIDANGHIVLVNREIERMFGYSREILLGERIEILVPERFRDVHPVHRAAYFAAPETRAMGAGRELFGCRADGTEFPVEIGLNPVETESGVFVLGAVVDISAREDAERNRREMEDRLRHAQKMEALGTLAGGIAHEFNNILGMIVGYSELVRSALPPHSSALADITKVLSSVDRGRELVSRILAVSRRQDSARRPLALDSIVSDFARLLRATIPASIEMQLSVDPQTPRVFADATAIHQILMNLGTNAVHAMPGGGRLSIVAEPFYARDSFVRVHTTIHQGLCACIVVTDTGVGMDRAVLARAVEPFFTTKGPGIGTGLGLAMVDGIMRDHGGVVDIASEPGQGTTVRCVFPALDSTADDPIVPANAPPLGKGERVLFVDDEPALAELGERRLSALGYRVTAVTDSALALEMVRRRSDEFDAVVTDYYMPKLTGFALASELSRIRPGLPILMMTGNIGELDVAALTAAGVTITLEKPTSLQQIANLLRQALDGEVPTT